MPDFGFSPDAEFPIINGEKGNVSAAIDTKDSQVLEGDLKLIEFKSGLRPNMVPESASAVLEVLKGDIDFQADFDQFLAENDLKGDLSVDGKQVSITVVGKSAHGSTPHKGVNGATQLGRFLSQYRFDDQAAENFVQVLSHELFEGFDGSKVGVSHHHDVMGDVSMNIGIANYDAEKGGHIDVNFRYPEGTEPDTMLGQMEKALGHYASLQVSMGHHKDPHYVPADDPLVETLLDVYHKQTGFEAHEQSIGGGTYGRLMPRGVAYGALFPDSIDVMHQANEFLAVEDLLRATAIYAEAIYRLTK